MTYRNKLLIKRTLIVLGIVAGVVAVVLLIGFIYLGRYLVYTEDGARFSFNDTVETTQSVTAAAAPSSIELVTGSPIPAAEVVPETDSELKSTDVRGLLLDYETLSDDMALRQMELDAEEYNTLVLEIRIPGEELLSSDALLSLVSRAHTAGMHTAAIFSCLCDNSYALSHQEEALQLEGGALWMDEDGAYWLDPANENVITHLAQQILELSQMGFDEVILKDLRLPSGSYVYDMNGLTEQEILESAYKGLQPMTAESCRLGLLILEANSTHPLQEAADRLYVWFEDGALAGAYAADHPGKYLVFITDSHDTRFDEYGKVEADSEYYSAAAYVPRETTEEGEVEGEGEGDGSGDYEEETYEEPAEEYSEDDAGDYEEAPAEEETNVEETYEEPTEEEPVDDYAEEEPAVDEEPYEEDWDE